MASSSSNRRMASSSSTFSNRTSSTSSNRRMASSSMPSSSSKRSSYDVFLSFRGEDVCKTFLGHLYTALVQKGIYTYKDDKDLRTGEQISPALMKAIEESQIAGVVFSKNYASSAWCLDELAKIMECEKQRDLTVFLVFYKVDPRELRTPRTIYKHAMDKHKNKFMKDLGKVERWEKALSAAGNLSGRHFTDGHVSTSTTSNSVLFFLGTCSSLSFGCYKARRDLPHISRTSPHARRYTEHRKFLRRTRKREYHMRALVLSEPSLSTCPLIAHVPTSTQ